MRPDKVIKLPKYLTRQGVAGFTTLAFLVTQLSWPLPVSAQDTLRQEPIPESKSGLEELKAKFQGERSVIPESSTIHPIAAGMEGGEEEKEPQLTTAEQRVAQTRYQLPPEGLVLEYDPARSIPCCLGHPPLLWRVRVVDTSTGQTTYIGTGCCQTLFGKSSGEISTAQTAVSHRLALIAKYAPILGDVPEVTGVLQAIREKHLTPAIWKQIETLTTVLDAQYRFPISELDRMAKELRSAPRLRRLMGAGLVSSEEAAFLESTLAKLAPAAVYDPPTQEEVRILRSVHTRLAKHPLFLATRTIKGWARGETPSPMSPEERAREEQRMPNWIANLWIANLLLPGIQSGAITHVLDGGAGEEPLYRLPSSCGPPIPFGCHRTSSSSWRDYCQPKDRSR